MTTKVVIIVHDGKVQSIQCEAALDVTVIEQGQEFPLPYVSQLYTVPVTLDLIESTIKFASIGPATTENKDVQQA